MPEKDKGYRPTPERKREARLNRLAAILTELNQMWRECEKSQVPEVRDLLVEIGDIIQDVKFADMRIGQGYDFKVMFAEIEQDFKAVKQKFLKGK